MRAAFIDEDDVHVLGQLGGESFAVVAHVDDVLGHVLQQRLHSFDGCSIAANHKNQRTAFGGDFGAGSVFQLTPSGDLTTLLSFNGTNGLPRRL